MVPRVKFGTFYFLLIPGLPRQWPEGLRKDTFRGSRPKPLIRLCPGLSTRRFAAPSRLSHAARRFALLCPLRWRRMASPGGNALIIEGSDRYIFQVILNHKLV